MFNAIPKMIEQNGGVFEISQQSLHRWISEKYMYVA